MSSATQTQGADPTTHGTEGTQASAGGLLHGTTENSGPERLTSAGGALGGEAQKPTGTQSAGDARPQPVSETPEQAGRDASSMSERQTAHGSVPEGAGSTDPHAKKNESAEAKHPGVALHSEQSENVNNMLKEADKIVKEKHMTTHPEDEPGNKEDAVAEGAATATKTEHKEGLMDKVKHAVHKS